METFQQIIERIEAHTGEKFDFKNRRHRLHLSSTVNRMAKKYNKLFSNIENVLQGEQTYDANEYRLHTIPKNQR